MGNEHDALDAARRGRLTRRGFLRMLGAVGGTAMVFGAMDAWDMGLASAQDAPPGLEGGGNGTRVIILGAGLAGMTAAYELGKLGYDTPILEARDYAGGRCQTARNGFALTETNGVTQVCDFAEGQYINHGAWRIPYHHRSTLHYTKEFGVPLEIMVNENDAAYALYRDIDGPFAGQRVRRMKVKADLRGYTSEILAKAMNQQLLDLELSAEDRERLVAYLVHEGYLDSEDLVYRGTGGRGYEVDPGAGLEPGPGVPSDPYDFLPLLRSGLGATYRSVNSYSQQATMFEPVGGMDRIARGFEAAVGDRITYNAQVQEIRQTDGGVRVAYRNPESGETGQLEGDYCICTIPLSVLSQIPADFSEAFRRAVQGVAYTPTGKIGLQFASRFWETEDHIYGGHSNTDYFGNISYPSYGWQGDKGVILGYYNFGSEAVRVSGFSPEERAEYALENGEPLHPEHYRSEYEKSFSVAWHLVPYSLGGWASWSAESRENAYPVLNEPEGRVYLAGEHLSYLTGWQAGAIESAWIQIEKLHQRAVQQASGRRSGAVAG